MSFFSLLVYSYLYIRRDILVCMLANIKENRFAVPGLFILNILSFPASLIVVYTVYHIKTAAINLVPFDKKNSLKD